MTAPVAAAGPSGTTAAAAENCRSEERGGGRAAGVAGVAGPGFGDPGVARLLAGALRRDAERVLEEQPPRALLLARVARRGGGGGGEAGGRASRRKPGVYTGDAGLALLFWHVHLNDLNFELEGKGALALARMYVEDALENCEARKHECSFIISAVGVYAVGAVVFHHCGIEDLAKNCIEQVVALEKTALSPRTPSEPLYGRAGYLYALKFLQKYIPASLLEPLVPPALVASVYEAIIEDGQVTAARELPEMPEEKRPMTWEWHGSFYAGGAHGSAGILTCLLAFEDLAEEYEKEIRATLSHLFSLIRPNWRFPIHVDQGHRQSESDYRLVQFCHGAPGIGLCAAKAYEIYGDEEYLEVAKYAAEAVWGAGLLYKGVGLCHGVGGNGYIFLTLFKFTGNQIYWDRAVSFAVACAEWEQKTKEGAFRVPDHPWSLYEGLAGGAYFVGDVVYFEPAAYKGFPGLSDV